MFEIKDVQLEIKSAILEAFIDDDNEVMDWGIEIIAASLDKDNIPWDVKLSSDSIFSTIKNQLVKWADVANLKFSWDESINDEDEARALMYVFQHEPVYKCEGEFYLNEANVMCIRWKGKCDIYWNEKYSTGLDFFIDCPVFFKGVWFGKEIDPVCAKLLSKYITKEKFVYAIERNVSLMKPPKKSSD